jgi:hypothetical protein
VCVRARVRVRDIIVCGINSYLRKEEEA